MIVKIKNRLILPFLYFFRSEASSGIILLICTITAIIIANSNLASVYNDVLHKYATIGYGDFSISMSILHWINDGLMVIFFFVVGMEIKRELVIGELKSIRRTILPVGAAIGGMIVPAIIYIVFNYNSEAITGWGIPMATDIAFALGILSIVGSEKAPKGIVVFLTALAIVDDLGAIIVIAIFYTSKFQAGALIAGFIVLALLIMANKFGVKYKSVFIIGGIILWICFLKSGVHATISGVLLGMTIPTSKEANEFKNSMLYKFEHMLTPWSSYLIMPVFALANSGVVINFEGFSQLIISPVSLGIIFGLVVGKQLGIFLVSYGLIKLKIAKLSHNVTKLHLYGASVLGGIGFTMSLFIASLSFKDESVLSMAKISIISASILSAFIGLMIFKFIKPGKKLAEN